MGGLRFSFQGSEHGGAVDASWRAGSRDSGERWQNIPMRHNVVADASGFNLCRPADDHRHADAAFIHVALITAQAGGAVKEVGVRSAFVMRAVVAREKNDGVGIDA